MEPQAAALALSLIIFNLLTTTSPKPCPSVTGLDLPLFPPTNTCCVYSPGNLDAKGELDLRGLKCKGYTSVVSLGDYPTDPSPVGLRGGAPVQPRRRVG
ncbi:hypothetical protein M0R45_005081 [Rubus argutus]|uniref:Uncharacterized protein n=1 Tax=Rubus argutus TaxID=59490 RepID=A0AAW1YM61_RUBAR